MNLSSGAGGGSSGGAVAALPALALVAASGLVAAVGLVGNAALLAALLTQQSARLRNSLLLHVCAADLLVCAVSVPLAACARWGWALAGAACHAVAFLQAAPVAASTLSLATLALDRWAAVAHPRLRHRRHVTAALLAAVWALAALACAPLPLLRCSPHDPATGGVGGGRAGLAATASGTQGPRPALRAALALARLALVHVLPIVAVGACHVAVALKLLETSLTAAAARGEVPLPMPLLCRRPGAAGPRHVIIVASVAGEGPSKMVPYRRGADDLGDSSSEEEDASALPLRLQADADLRPPPRRKRRRSRAKQRAQANCTPQETPLRGADVVVSDPSGAPRRGVHAPPAPSPSPPPPPAALLVKPQSLRSRRHLARVLLAQMTLFAALWLPLVACELCAQIAPLLPASAPAPTSSASPPSPAPSTLPPPAPPPGASPVHGATPAPPRAAQPQPQPSPPQPPPQPAVVAVAERLLPIALLLGHAHSAVSPLLYWLLNRQALQGCGAARAFPGKLRLLRLLTPGGQAAAAAAAAAAEYNNPSSTNEAALGAFHPRYTAPRARPPRCATSQFLQ